MQTFATPAPVSVVLDIPAGRIQLIAADRPDTTVEIRPADAAKNRDTKAAERIDVAYDGEVLRIGAQEAANRLLGHTGAVEITVRLPAGSHVEAKAADAELRGVGRLGDVTYDGARSTVKLDEAATARLTVQAGDITLGRLTGPAEISTRKGDIRVTEAARGTVTLRTDLGDIAVGTPRGTSASLDAGTAHGRITNSLTNTEGDAAVTFHATTAHGDITARSL